MSGAGNMKVDFGGLETATQDILASAAKLDGRINDLESELAPMRDNWEGEAQASYLQAKAKWDQGMREIKDILMDIGKAVGQANSDYQATEKANAGRWG